jgi:maleate isomerase
MSPQPAAPLPDPRGGHGVRHAGVLVPWANLVMEAELPRWAGTSVAWHYARLVPASRGTALDEEFLGGLLAAVPAALGQLAALPLPRVYLGCTSAGFMLPNQPANATACTEVPVITAFDAILAALQQRQATRILLLTPYPEPVCDTEAATFADRGIVVTGRATLNLRDGYAAIEPGQICELARRAGRRAAEEAQVIVLSCTGWPTFGLDKTLGRQLGREVVSSNRAIALHALQAGAGERR